MHASVGQDGTTLLCRTPVGSSNATRPLSVEVTLNGQQFTSGGARFDHFGEPSFSAVYPLMGPVVGGTPILLTGTGFHDFGRVSRFPGAWDDLHCRFGNDSHFVYAPTTLVQHTGLQCLSPALSKLGGAGELRLPFDTLPNASALLGDAQIKDGILILTQPTPQQTGTFIVRPETYAPPLMGFDAAFEVLIGGGSTNAFDNARLTLL